jgi:hypothetical protein
MVHFSAAAGYLTPSIEVYNFAGDTVYTVASTIYDDIWKYPQASSCIRIENGPVIQFLVNATVPLPVDIPLLRLCCGLCGKILSTASAQLNQ